eukprot:TRINITY_DN33210_c0_g1_i1.p1 TRINITY_DN33210_c0_g1~~TRINITY_DN33210_c0_g1_i1.p1  ORF type:complete len:349 (-),score=32.61 TRINITY_DN33210_c0_g1_i1:301-1347(-)
MDRWLGQWQCCRSAFAVLLASAAGRDTTTPHLRLIDPWEVSDFPQPVPSPRAHPPWDSAQNRLSSNNKARQLAVDPDVWLVPDFIDLEEADGLMRLLHDRYDSRDLQPRWCFDAATYRIRERFRDVAVFQEGELECVDGQQIGQVVLSKGNQSVSRTAVIASGESWLTDNIGKLIESEAGLPLTRAHHTQITEYGRNQALSAHQDCQVENGASATALVYLSDVDAGGHTCFEELGFCVMPRQGTALFFASRDKDGECSSRSKHSTNMVRSGSKFVLQRQYFSNYTSIAASADAVVCAEAALCRQSFHNHSRWKSHQLTTQGTELLEPVRTRKLRRSSSWQLIQVQVTQ